LAAVVSASDLSFASSAWRTQMGFGAAMVRRRSATAGGGGAEVSLLGFGFRRQEEEKKRTRDGLDLETNKKKMTMTVMLPSWASFLLFGLHWATFHNYVSHMAQRFYKLRVS
jgi:hypothetical protein